MNFKPAPLSLTIRCSFAQGKLTFEDAFALVRYTLLKPPDNDSAQPSAIEIVAGVRGDGRTRIDHTKWKLSDYGSLVASRNERVALLTFRGKDFSEGLKSKCWANQTPNVPEAERLSALYQAIIDQDIVQLAIPTQIDVPKQGCEELESIKLTSTLIVQLNYQIRSVA